MGASGIASTGEIAHPLHIKFTMRTTTLKAASIWVVAGFAASGCTTHRDGRVVNPRQPGPAIGTGVGVATGAVVGNAAGAVVGAGEGFVAAAGSAFDADRRVVRTWRTETTADGRTIRVPVEIEVDEYGRPVGQTAAAK
jgi:hypothetical protein